MESYYSFDLINRADKKTWNINLEADSMMVTEIETGDTIKIPRNDRPGDYKMTRLPFLPVMLTIYAGRKLVFKLTEDQVNAISTWRGPLTATDMALLLKERYKWLLPIAVVLIIVSFPVMTDSSTSAWSTMTGYMNMGLGIMLLVIYILSKSTLSRMVFLLDCIWFILAGFVVAADVYMGHKYISLILIPLLFIGAWSGMYEFKRFKDMK